MVPTAQLHQRARQSRAGHVTWWCVRRHWNHTEHVRHQQNTQSARQQDRRELPSTVSVTLVSPSVTLSCGALTSQRYLPASVWVTLCNRTVAPLISARPWNDPEQHRRERHAHLSMTFSFLKFHNSDLFAQLRVNILLFYTEVARVL